jgi:hypothetical protein
VAAVGKQGGGRRREWEGIQGIHWKEEGEDSRRKKSKEKGRDRRMRGWGRVGRKVD